MRQEITARRIVALAVTVCALWCGVALAKGPGNAGERYTIVPLPSPDGAANTWGVLEGISDLGTAGEVYVVGYQYDASSKSDRGYCWTVNATGSVESVLELDDGMLRGVASLPHGYGMSYKGSEPVGPQINRLTASAHCDPLSKTPFHKYVPVHIEKAHLP